MAIKDILGKIMAEKEERPEEEEFLEVNPEALNTEQKISVKIDTLKDFMDVDRIQGMLREGNVIFLKIRDLRDRDISELKRSVDKLRKTCLAMDGDMVGVDEDFLVITPSYARVYRGHGSV